MKVYKNYYILNIFNIFAMLIKISQMENLGTIDTIIDEYVYERKLENIIGCDGKNVYNDYVDFCKQFGYTPLTRVSFSKRLYARFNLTGYSQRVNGELVRIVVRKN